MEITLAIPDLYLYLDLFTWQARSQTGNLKAQSSHCLFFAQSIDRLESSSLDDALFFSGHAQ